MPLQVLANPNVRNWADEAEDEFGGWLGHPMEAVQPWDCPQYPDNGRPAGPDAAPLPVATRSAWGNYHRITGPSGRGHPGMQALGHHMRQEPMPGTQDMMNSQVGEPGHGGMWYFHDGKPPGYKIWVGDLQPETTQEGLEQRIRVTLTNMDILPLMRHVRKVNVLPGRASSGSSYAVSTVADMEAAQVPGH